MVAKRLGLDAEKEEAASFDFYSPAFREAYFEDVHHPLEDQGVDFWWIDWQQGSHGKMDPLWVVKSLSLSRQLSYRSSWSYFIALWRSWQPPVSDRFFRGYHCDLGNLSLSTLFYQHSFKYRLYVVESRYWWPYAGLL